MLTGVLNFADSLPPYPDVVRCLLPLVRQMAPREEIERVMRLDPAIAARTLAYACAGGHGTAQAVRSLHDAVASLGYRQLIHLIIRVCSLSARPTSREHEDDWYEELWRHSVATALMAEMIARRLGCGDGSVVYSAALLHDIGRMLLQIHVRTYRETVATLLRDRPQGLLDAERQVLGLDHQQLGAIVARRWHFPLEVVMAIGCHHHPSRVLKHRETVALVYMANCMARTASIGCGTEGLWQAGEDPVFAEYGVSELMVTRFMNDLRDAMERTLKGLAATEEWCQPPPPLRPADVGMALWLKSL
jgi:putative nucleotidyltransferase with HDIG domain